jgi:type IX secretion system substrate protein
LRKHFYKISFICFFALSASLSGQSLFFEKSFGTGSSDQSLSVKQLSDGSIYIAGNSDSITPGDFDVTLSKLDRYGNFLWTRYYDGGRNDFAFHLITLPDNSLVLAGSRQQPSGLYDALVIRTDTSGAIMYQNTFGNASQDESFAYISQDGYGQLIACGYAATSTASNNVYVVKLNTVCSLIWQNQYGGADVDYGQKIIPASDSGYVFVADTRSFGSGTYDLWLCKIDTAGAVEWNYVSVDTLQNGSQGVIASQDGSYIMYGETEITSSSPFNFYMEKVSAAGVPAWKKNFGDPLYSDAIFEMIELPGREFICTGYSNTYNHGAALDLVIFRVDSTGNVQWAKSYGGPGVDIGYDIIPSFNGGYLVTGTSVLANDQYYLLSVDTLGLLTNIPALLSSPDELSLFPNPSDGAFSIIANEQNEMLSIRIFSITGQMLYNTTSKDPVIKLDLRKQLAPGSYIVQIINQETVRSGRLIIR